MYVCDRTHSQAKCKNDKYTYVTTYTNLTSKVMNYYLDFSSFWFSQLWKKNLSKFKKSYYTWPHSVARTNTDNGVLV